MNDFVEQCRREWRRLRVPVAVADEMAADLAADLAEAEAEGESSATLLGGGAADPRAFAASWAAERGVIPLRRSGAFRARSIVLVAVAALTVTSAIGALLVVFDSRPELTPVAVPGVFAGPRAPASLPRAPVPAPFASPEDAVSVWVQRDGRGVLLARADSGVNRVGSILLILGLAGSISSLLALYWTSRSRDRPPPGPPSVGAFLGSVG